MTEIRQSEPLGCLCLIPGGLIGAAGLADGAGPPGWWGLAEMFGWFGVCLLLAVAIDRGIAHLRRGRGGIAAGLLLALAAGTVLALFSNYIGLDAPMWQKSLFTGTLQFVGTAIFPVGLVWALWFFRG